MKNLSVVAASAMLLLACTAPVSDEGEERLLDSDVSVRTELIVDGSVAYRTSLVKISFPGAGSCSGSLIGWNLIATAAHCVVPNAGFVGSGSGLVSARVLYQPDSTTRMCLNNSCQETSGAARYTFFAAYWDPSYANNDPDTDVAIMMGAGDALTTFPNTPNGAAVPDLQTRDFRRILGANVAMPWSRPGAARGYGATADAGGSSDAPVEGGVWVTNWSANMMTGPFSEGWPGLCLGDSGGPVIWSGDSLEYIGGVASRIDGGLVGNCPETGDSHEWHRIGTSVGLIDDVLAIQGRPRCRRYTDSSLPGSGRYYRCW